MLRIYYGPDTYSRQEAVQRLKQELDRDGMLSANTATLDGARLSLPELVAVCDTIPFLAEQRLVIVTDLLARAQTQRSRGRGGRARGEQNGDDLSELAAYSARMPPTTTLLLLEGALRADNPLLAALKDRGEVRHFPLLNAEQTAAWVRERTRQTGAPFEPRAVQALVGVAGSDLWTLAAEVEKLSLYAAGRAVTEADVRQLVAAAQESNIFMLVDAVVDGRPEIALRQLRLLLQGGAAGPYLITMIARQYRQLIVVQDLTQAGAPPQAIMQAAEVRYDSMLRRLRQQAQRRGAARLQAAYERILAADLAIKRGEADEETALELLVADLTTS